MKRTEARRRDVEPYLAIAYLFAWSAFVVWMGWVMT